MATDSFTPIWAQHQCPANKSLFVQLINFFFPVKFHKSYLFGNVLILLMYLANFALWFAINYFHHAGILWEMCSFIFLLIFFYISKDLKRFKFCVTANRLKFFVNWDTTESRNKAVIGSREQRKSAIFQDPRCSETHYFDTRLY